MARWEPNAAGRLREAALELFEERGFEQTTVAEIAARAGLTERTFFRHFADKREVLFRGSEALRDMLVAAIDEAPAAASPLEAVTAALDAAGAAFAREFARRRRAVILANPELLERELIKLASLTDALADALRGRGVRDPVARLASETGMAVFRITFERWVTDPGQRPWAEHLHEALAELDELVLAAPQPAA
ncbi:MAG TPA: helix-turn-helix domain-containing protein [Solirubrobacteraceae bacterium]|jgi:AcrR family transcriptional regulator|nr:helix-turn-helix domain-containing protein [Solirubrobacteraceae bacterium]